MTSDPSTRATASGRGLAQDSAPRASELVPRALPVGLHTVAARVRQTITTHRLLPPRAGVIVAVSGGADSVALLHLLMRLQGPLTFTLHVAHVDHGLRETSAEDARFVQALGARWGVPVSVERRPVGPICEREGWSLEDGARRVRYQVLLELARRHRASRIALAHTADDQAETVLMRLVRGTGLLGLGAIPIQRPLDDEIWVVRPLLAIWRREVLAYLEEAGLAYREDETNGDRRFVRNRIRRELLPLLERDYNPNIKGALTQLAEQSRWDYAYLQEAAGRQWKRMVKVHPHPSRGVGAKPPRQVAISIPMFLRQPKALQRQLVRQAILHVRGELGRFEFRHWVEAERLFVERPAGTVLDLPSGVRLRRDTAHVVCTRDPQLQPAGPDGEEMG